MIVTAIYCLANAIRHAVVRRRRIHPLLQERRATERPSLLDTATRADVRITRRSKLIKNCLFVLLKACNNEESSSKQEAEMIVSSYNLVLNFMAIEPTQIVDCEESFEEEEEAIAASNIAASNNQSVISKKHGISLVSLAPL